MAKPLVFDFNGQEVAFEMSKVDRSKLYGYKDTEVLDEQGRKCELATLGEDGQTIVGKGGTAIGYLSADGLWCDKKELRPIDLEGKPIEPVRSSFSAPVPLSEKVSIEDYLSHTIRSAYAMQSDNVPAELLDELKSGAIYKFPYSFRGGLVADAGFLLMNFAGEVFFAVGDDTALEFIGLPQAGATVAEDVDDSDEDNLMDFDMI